MRKILLGLCLVCFMGGCAVIFPGPPTLVFRARPALVAIGGTGVYYASDVHADLFMYGNVWYRYHQGHWFRASVYSGPWVHVSVVPQVFYRIPPGHAKYHCVPGHKKGPGPGPMHPHKRKKGPKW